MNQTLKEKNIELKDAMKKLLQKLRVNDMVVSTTISNLEDSRNDGKMMQDEHNDR